MHLQKLPPAIPYIVSLPVGPAQATADLMARAGSEHVVAPRMPAMDLLYRADLIPLRGSNNKVVKAAQAQARVAAGWSGAVASRLAQLRRQPEQPKQLKQLHAGVAEAPEASERFSPRCDGPNPAAGPAGSASGSCKQAVGRGRGEQHSNCGCAAPTCIADAQRCNSGCAAAACVADGQR